MLTFEPHPLQVVRPEAAPKLLTSLDAKAELIGRLGVDDLVVIPFDRGFADQSPEEFIDHVLVERLQATRVSVGENFRFGHRAAGDPEMLAADGRFETRVVPLVEVDGEIVSSSHIRGLVLAGEVELAQRFLGAPFRMTRGGGPRRRARPHARVPDRQHRAGRGARVPRDTASTWPAPGTARAPRSASACGRRSGPDGRCSSRPI